LANTAPRFPCPQAGPEKEIYLVYEGVLTDTATSINGQVVAGVMTNATITGTVTNALAQRSRLGQFRRDCPRVALAASP
jgi:hypothetical protein